MERNLHKVLQAERLPCEYLVSRAEARKGGLITTTPFIPLPAVVSPNAISPSYGALSTSGVNVGGYARRVAKGDLLPITRFNQTEVRTSQHCAINGFVTGGGARAGHYYQYQFSSRGGPCVNLDQSLRESVRNVFDDDRLAIGTTGRDELQLQAAAARIQSDGFDALTSAAEFHKVLAMLTGIRKRFFKELSSGRLYNLWLEGRYGWRTLLFEIQDFNQAVKKLGKRPGILKDLSTWSVSQEYSKVVHPRVVFNAAFGSLPFNLTPKQWPFELTVKRTLKVKANVAAKVEVPAFQADLAVTAWELIPYSFVIDWFINVGQWYNALKFTVNSGGRYEAGVTRVEDLSYRAACAERLPFYQTADHQWYQVDAQLDYNRQTINRNPARVTLRPRLNVRLDAFKVTDLIALAAQRVIGNKRRK